MFFSKQKIRELVFQMLYAQDFSGSEKSDMIPFMMRSFLISQKNMKQVSEKCSKILENLGEIDQKIAGASPEYKFERISPVEKNILRIMLFELLYEKLPIKVAVDEGLRLCKKFSTAEAGSFIHALLDKIYHEHFATTEEKPVTV